MMHYFRPLFSAALALVAMLHPSAAEDVLPPAHGLHSFAFVVPSTTAPFPTGARVEFIAWKDNEAPRRLRVYGYVLGSHDNVAFVELAQRDAVRLVQARQIQTVKLVKIADPEPGLVAERRAMAAKAVPVEIAWNMRTLTVRVSATAEDAADWARGDRMIFTGVERDPALRYVVGYYTQRGDVTGILLSAEPAGPGEQDIRIFADPAEATEILKAATAGPLAVVREETAQAEAARTPRGCFVRRRRGGEFVAIQIPCRSD